MIKKIGLVVLKCHSMTNQLEAMVNCRSDRYPDVTIARYNPKYTARI